MAKSLVNRKVLRKAKVLVAEGKRLEVPVQSPLPVISVLYPRHGQGALTHRFMRVTKADDKVIRGYEIESEFDEEPGQYKTFTRRLAQEIVFLHL
jgi:hypothetical protein